jgi:uncharacterized membrane protein YozB (DUF420 family)
MAEQKDPFQCPKCGSPSQLLNSKSKTFGKGIRTMIKALIIFFIMYLFQFGADIDTIFQEYGNVVGRIIMFSLIIYLLLGIINLFKSPFVMTTYKCNACRTTWKA